MLTRIRNAQMAGHSRVALPHSKLKEQVALILSREGFIGKAEKKDGEKFPELVIELKYREVTPTRRDPAIREITRVSKEGCRIYVQSNQIQKVKNGYGIAIISTSKGVMTGGEAYRRGLGGEYICKVW